jgi:hypothetical protein|tara:strand:+ start:1227 stop:1469 length:243 start_codon:yes stop_codon:yes gene_type:complete
MNSSFLAIGGLLFFGFGYKYYGPFSHQEVDNPSSMTDENGDGQIVYGVWEKFRGMTITLYGGYYCDLEEQHLDSVKVFIQ